MNENHLRKRNSHNRGCSHGHGFIEKLIKDCKKIYNYEKHEIKFKNNKPDESKAYEPTELEHIANIFSHGILILPSFYGSLTLLHKSTINNHTSDDHVLVSLIYGSSLVLLFSISFIYHCVFYLNHNLLLKDLLHRMDRAMIYIFIAGSYFPWLTLEHFKYTSIISVLRYLIWILASLGIIYQQIFHERYKRIETIFYILIAFLPALLIMFFGHDLVGMFELEMGGAVYLIGVIFFKSDGKLCCAHALWHIFVGVAATIHYFAILRYLFTDEVVHEHMKKIANNNLN